MLRFLQKTTVEKMLLRHTMSGNSQRNIRRWKSGVSERGNFRKTMIFHIRPLTVLPGSTDLKMAEVCTRSMKVRRHSRRIIQRLTRSMPFRLQCQTISNHRINCIWHWYFPQKKTPKQPTIVLCLRKRIWTWHFRFNVLRREPEVRLFIHRRI